MSFPATTITASTVHGPPILGAGCPTVLIGGKPAWRVGDTHTCPMVNAPPPAGPGTPHGPGITLPPGSVTVLVGGMPACRTSDKVSEPGAVVPPLPINVILPGVPTVLIK